MVGYRNGSSDKLTQYDYMLAGASSGFITRCLCQPLDVLKIRFQLQVEPISKSSKSKYQSITQAVATICKEEGIKSLWKGHVPAQLLSVVYGLVQFWSFEVLTKQAHTVDLDSRFKIFVNFSCGAIAGCNATLASFPFDVIRTRLVSQSEQNKLYSSVTLAFRQVVKNEGFFALYKGLFPTFIQVAPHTGLQFMCYKLFEDLYQFLLNLDDKFTVSGSLVCGSLAGLVAKTGVYPLDLVKKRMQIQGMQQHRSEFGKVFICKGMTDCLKRIYESEGIIGFFKGWSPSMYKAVFATAIHFTSYELVCNMLLDYRS